MHNGRLVNCASGEFEALTELATICAMCNESSVDYNDVRLLLSSKNAVKKMGLLVLENKRFHWRYIFVDTFHEAS